MFPRSSAIGDTSVIVIHWYRAMRAYRNESPITIRRYLISDD